MQGIDIVEKPWITFATKGQEPGFFSINYSVLYTWIILGIIAALLIPVYIILKRKPGLVHFMLTSAVNYFVNLVTSSIGFFHPKHCIFIGGLFMMILLCNIIPLLPGIVEPTKDINTTLAFGIVAFLYTEFNSIKTHGILAYIKQYFEPFFPMLPLNVVGKIASVVSISFRLFGNIFGGVIIAEIYFNAIKGAWLTESFGILSGANLIVTFFFGLFEGFLQAYVFAMLSVTYLSIALQGHQPEASADTQEKLSTQAKATTDKGEST